MKYAAVGLAAGLLLGAIGAIVALAAGGAAQGRGTLLGDRVIAACKPWPVSDWNVDYADKNLIRVTCYDPKTSNLRQTVVER